MFWPVAMPSLAATIWMTMAINDERTTTHNNAVPYLDPPAMFVAQFPGSM